MNTRDLWNKTLQKFTSLDYVHPEDVPNINLYVDQVTTFLEDSLNSAKRTDEDKIITKTMINNYTKNHVLPSPDKKKYSKDHVISLIIIYYLKDFLAIKDIQTILDPMMEQYFGSDSDFSLSDIYARLVSFESTQAKELIRDVMQEYTLSSEIFADAPEEDQENLQKFAFYSLLSFDIYVKKMLLEAMLDFDEADKLDTSTDNKNEKNSEKVKEKAGN